MTREVRPYPNVVQRAGRRWAAYQPCRDGKRVHLGVYPTPEDARRAVLNAQAEHYEQKARAYRAAAAALNTGVTA